MPKPQTRSDQSVSPALSAGGVEFQWPGEVQFSISLDKLDIEQGERLLLLGPSGAGKSTLLSLVCGIATPQAGTIRVLGQNLQDMRATARDRFRAEHFGIIFQMFNLLPYASALDNVLLPLNFASGRRERASQDRPVREEAVRVLAALGIDGALATRGNSANLSVGQQQRVAAARALIGVPELIVADEPTSALDSDSQNRFLDLLFGQVEDVGTTLIMVSHDERLAPRFNRVLQLHDVVEMHRGEAA